ncbi:MAG: GerW family sporulation protein [Clostridia bacterium]|nr:GerW family sporulation protein [Clostridia bacterium]
MANNVNNLLGVSIDKIKEMVDVNMVVGNPINLPDNVTIIPVSRVSYGFASGGSDLPNKSDRDIFGGGSGAGINVTPVAFLVVKDGAVNMLPVVSKATTIDNAISMIPGMVDKVTALFKKNTDTEADAVVPAEQVDEITID